MDSDYVARVLVAEIERVMEMKKHCGREFKEFVDSYQNMPSAMLNEAYEASVFYASEMDQRISALEGAIKLIGGK